MLDNIQHLPETHLTDIKAKIEELRASFSDYSEFKSSVVSFIAHINTVLPPLLLLDPSSQLDLSSLHRVGQTIETLTTALQHRINKTHKLIVFKFPDRTHIHKAKQGCSFVDVPAPM